MNTKEKRESNFVNVARCLRMASSAPSVVNRSPSAGAKLALGRGFSHFVSEVVESINDLRVILLVGLISQRFIFVMVLGVGRV